MNVTIHIHPGAPPVDLEVFRSTDPRRAVIALDGYVLSAGTLRPKQGAYVFDHHYGDRLMLLATAGQVLMYVVFGNLVRDLWSRGVTHLDVFILDIDQDATLSALIFKHWQLWRSEVYLSKLIPLVMAMSIIDACGGLAYLGFSGVQQSAKWIFYPYERLRLSGLIDLQDAETFTLAFEAIERRFLAYIKGRGLALPLDHQLVTRPAYDAKQDSRFVMVDEAASGYDARAELARMGVRAIISVRDRDDGASAVSVGRVSSLHPLDISTFLIYANLAEPGPGVWRGGTHWGGSCRVHGTHLTDEQLMKIAKLVMDGVPT